MKYRVQFAPSVFETINNQVEYFLDQHASKERVQVWLTELYELTESLEYFPHRHAINKDVSARVGTEMRQFVFGDYLIFYSVDDAHNTVSVLHFRHSAHETSLPPNISKDEID